MVAIIKLEDGVNLDEKNEVTSERRGEDAQDEGDIACKIKGGVAEVGVWEGGL